MFRCLEIANRGHKDPRGLLVACAKCKGKVKALLTRHDSLLVPCLREVKRLARVLEPHLRPFPSKPGSGSALWGGGGFSPVSLRLCLYHAEAPDPTSLILWRSLQSMSTSASPKLQPGPAYWLRASHMSG